MNDALCGEGMHCAACSLARASEMAQVEVGGEAGTGGGRPCDSQQGGEGMD